MNFFYSITYHTNEAGKRSKPAKILFCSSTELSNAEIKSYILKKLQKPNAVVTLHSINTFPHSTYVSLGGNPFERFELLAF